MSEQKRDLALSGMMGAVALSSGLAALFFPGCYKSGRELAVYEIERAGGRVEVDQGAPGKPIVRIDFERSKRIGVTTFGSMQDEDWARLRPHLEALPRLRYIRITSMSSISDTGLTSLEGLKQLESLELYPNWTDGRAVTEAGVQRLRAKLPDVHISYFDTRPKTFVPPDLTGIDAWRKTKP
jgi:hypothetical protein